MKRILFVIGNAEIGGTRSSLFNLLEHLSKESALKVDLFILSHYGKLMDRIPQNVTVLPEMWLINSTLPGKKQSSFFQKIYHCLFYGIKAVFGYLPCYKVLFNIICRKIEKKYGVYDVAIGYQEGICNYFSAFVNAKKHFTWVHSDPEAWYVKAVFETNAYKNSERILFVSETTMEKFCAAFPEYCGKCCVVKNTINTGAIKKKAKDCVSLSKGKDELLLLSVGRIAEVKAFDRIIPVSIELKKNHIKFRWYILGDGPLKEDIKKQVEENDLAGSVLLLGATDNPYSYMVQSDLLVVTSLHESQPMVILEALTLGLPVLTTRYSSAEEILNSQPFGKICENSVEGLKEALLQLSVDDISRMKKEASTYEYNNRDIVLRLMSMI